MATYRLTYREPNVSYPEAALMEGSNVILQNSTLVVPGRTELQSSEGDILRLQKGTEFRLVEAEEGVQPVISGGEVFGVLTKSWIKYTRSCWNCSLHSSPPLQLLIRPHPTKDYIDEYLLAVGDMIIHEFDKNGRHFTICGLSGGNKAYVSYNPNIPVGPDRYSSEIESMTNEDWDYVLHNYLDHRKWMHNI